MTCGSHKALLCFLSQGHQVRRQEKLVEDIGSTGLHVQVNVKYIRRITPARLQQGDPACLARWACLLHALQPRGATHLGAWRSR